MKRRPTLGLPVDGLKARGYRSRERSRLSRELRVETLETRELLAVAPFQMPILETGTPLSEFNNGQYQLAVADWDLDGKEDMFAIRTTGTVSGKVEVSIYSGASGFQTRIAKKITALNTSPVNLQFRVIQHAPNILPLIAVFNPNDSSGNVSVDTLSGYQNYGQSSHFVTSLPAGSHWDFDMAYYDSDNVLDVFAIDKQSPFGKVAVTVLSGKDDGSGNYITQLHLGITPQDNVSEGFEFRVRDWGPGGGSADLVAIRRYLPGSTDPNGKTIVWAYSQSSGYTELIAAVVTTLENTPGNTYQFDVRDIQGTTSSHDGLPELVLFSTFGTGTGKSEIHIYTGEYLTTSSTIESHPDDAVLSGTVQLAIGDTLYIEGNRLTIEQVIEGPEGSTVIFQDGSSVLTADLIAGIVGIQTEFSLRSGAKITAYERMTVRAGNLPVGLDGQIVADLEFESGRQTGSPIIAGDYIGGKNTLPLTSTVLLDTSTPAALSLTGAITAQSLASAGTMTVQSLTLNRSVTLKEEILGSANTDYDQIISSGTVTLNNPVLLLEANYQAPAGSEFVMIKNDGSQSVIGTFSDETGLALTDGSIVSTNFGGTGRTARISYRGGDGNDVVIVVDGDYTFTSPPDVATSELRVVAANGVVQFFVNGVLTRARLFAGLNQLIVQGEAGKIDNVKVDFGVGSPIPVGGIALSTGSDISDSLTLLGGTADMVTHTLVDASTSTIALTTGATTQNIYYSKLAKITDNVATSNRNINMAAQPETAALSDSGISGITRLTVNGGRTIDFQTPGTTFNITAGTGVDKVAINGLGSGFGTPISIDTGAGTDSITVAGSLSGLGSLLLKSAAINLSAASIATVFAQTYTGAVKIGTSTVLTGSGLSFSSSVNPSASGIDLTLNTLNGGTTSLLGVVGNVIPFRSVTTNADGTTILKGNVSAAGGLLRFGDALTLQSNSIMTNTVGGVTLGGPASGPFAATINASATATIGGAVSGLTNLQITAATIALNSPTITTTGQQNYTGAVFVGVDQTLSGSQLKFNSTLNAGAADVDLTLNTSGAGTTSLLGNVGSTQPFRSLTTNIDGQTILTANISGAASTIVFNDPVALQSNLVLSDSGQGSLTFANTLDGGFNLQLASAGTSIFAGVVGGTTPVGRTTGPAIDIASTGTTLFSRSVRTAAHFNQRDTAGEITFKEDVTITAAADSLFSGNLVLDGLAFHTGRGITIGSDATDRVTLSTDDVNFDVPATKIATINSQITGPRGVTKSGAGTFFLKTAATYTGPTRISAGFITRSAADLLPDTTHLTIDAGNTFSLQNLNETIAGINGAGNIALGSATLSLANGGDNYDGVISGSGMLVVNAGLQILTGAHTYTGTTTVNGGNLQLAGGKIGATTPAGLVTIASGGLLSGTGVVNAAINGLAGSIITSTGNFALGLATSATGFVTAGTLNVGSMGMVTLFDKDTVTLQGNVTVAGGTLSVARAFSMGVGQTLSGLGTIVAPLGVMNLSGATLQPTGVLNTPGFQLSPTSTFSVAVSAGRIVATGPVSLNGSQLVIGPAGSYTHVNGQQTMLIDNDGTDPIVGEFANFPQGQEFNFGSEKFSRILYRSNFPSTANDVVVKAFEFAVTPTATVVDGNGGDPRVQFVTNDRGNTVYVWTGFTGINYVVYGPQGKPLGAIRTLSVSNQSVLYPNIVVKPDGGYAVFGISGSGNTQYVFSLDANGTSNGNPLVFTTSLNTSRPATQNTMDISFSSDGSAVLAWEESQNASPFRSRLVFQRFDATGHALDAAPKPVTQFVDQFTRPVRVLRDGVGNTYIAWRNYVANANRYDINVRRMLPDGTFIGTQPTILAQDIDLNSSSAPELRINSAGKLVFAYVPTNANAGHPTTVVVKQLAADLTTVSQKLFSLSGHTTFSLASNESGHHSLAYTDYPGSVLLQKVVWFAPDGKVQYVVSKNEPLNYASALSMGNDGSVVLGGASFNDHEFRTRAYGEPTDIIAGPLTTNFTSTLSFPYDLRFGASGPLRVRFLRSADTIIDATDQVLSTMTFTDAADLTVGRHTKSLSVGSQAGQVPLPGNGLPATTVDYYMLAMLDPDDELFELDVDSPSSDNLTSRFVHFNDAPVIGVLAASVSYTENAIGLPIAPAGTVIDVDAIQPGYTDFNGGKITFSLATNGDVNDRLEILNQGTAAGQISVTGTKLFYGGVQIGTFVGGSGLTPLVISFTTAAATPEAAQALLRAITFRTLGELPSTAPRTLTISLVDGDGGTSSLTSQTINVVSVPDAPVIGAFDTAVSYSENALPVVLDINATIVDIDSADFNLGTLTASIITNNELTDVLSIRPSGTGANAVSVSNNQVSVGGVVVGTFQGGSNGNPLAIAFNVSATPVRIQLLVRALAFNNTSEIPGILPRTVQLVMTDGDGGTSVAVSKVINVTAVNDIPIVGQLGPQITYSAGDAPIFITSAASVFDIDSANFDTGKLTVSITSNAQTSDRLAIKSVGTAVGQISTTADFKLFLGTVQIGTFAGGIGATPLAVTFNANTTPAVAQQVLASIQYSNTVATPSLLQRTARVVLTDGDKGTSIAVTQKINVNDDPVLGAFGGPVTYTRGGAAKLVTTTATVTDSSTNLNSGLLTLALTGSDGSDVLSIKTSATLTIANANEIFLNGIKIGTFTGGRNNTNLVIALTSGATAAKVQTLLRAIQFESTTVSASPSPRTLQVTLTDGVGGVSAAISKTINIL